MTFGPLVYAKGRVSCSGLATVGEDRPQQRVEPQLWEPRLRVGGNCNPSFTMADTVEVMPSRIIR